MKTKNQTKNRSNLFSSHSFLVKKRYPLSEINVLFTYFFFHYNITSSPKFTNAVIKVHRGINVQCHASEW